MGNLIRPNFGGRKPEGDGTNAGNSGAGDLSFRELVIRTKMAMRGLDPEPRENVPGTLQEIECALGADGINEKIAEISKTTHGRSTSGTVENALAIVRGYEDHEIRNWILESDPSLWMEKPSFFKALAIVAKERFSVG